MKPGPAMLDKKDLETFLKGLMEEYDLFAPVGVAEGVSVFKKVDSPEKIDLSSNPQKGVKETFFPQSEVMLRFDKAGGRTRVTETDAVPRKRLVFGGRPCDIQAVSILDPVFSGREHTDVYFVRKRDATTIVGLACAVPCSTCFCASLGGGPFAREGSDLFLTDLGDGFLVEVLTEKGASLRENRLLRNAEPGEIIRARETEEKALRKADRSVPIDGIERKLDQMIESPFWDRLHEKCLGCGVCTLLCPTCHCFDIVDEASHEKGQRIRNWDSCLFPLYSLETSGHNPRPSGRERTRQRLMHKFNYFPKNFEKIACVGCGRCIVYCPVNFDLRQVIREIQATPSTDEK